MKPNLKTRVALILEQQQQMFLPRVQMMIILLLTGCAGFLSSFLMLHSGIAQMWMRFPLAILAAYVAFLLLLRLWIAIHSPRDNFDLNSDLSLPIGNLSGGGNSADADFSFGGGGDFGGAGAGGGWDGGDSPSPTVPTVSTASTVSAVSLSSSSGGRSGGSSALDGISLDGDSEGIGLIILAVAAVIAGFIATLYVVYIAPALLAEILVDAVLLRGLHKRVKNIERKHWLQTAVRQTLLPAILCAIFFAVAGGLLQIAVPDANSIGEVWRELKSDKPAN